MKLFPRLFILFAVVTNIFLLCGCATVPYTGRTQFMMTSEAEENRLGSQAWNKLLAQEKISSDKKQNAALQRVGRNIAAVSGKPEYHWEFKVFVNPAANAFCLPGGKVGVTNSLFNYTANDAELATVVGHEIGHALARHGGERMTQGMVQELGAQAVSYTTEEAAFVTAFGLVTDIGVMLPFSREQEYEADYIGLILMAKAGYYPPAAISFWEKFGKLGNDQTLLEWISTHPMSKKRLDEMKKFQAKALEYYNKAPVKHGVGESL